VKSLVPLLVVLLAASVFGIWFQRTRGEFRRKKTINGPRMSPDQIGIALGERVTMVQFSSAFCSPCRATRVLLEQMVQTMTDVVYVHIDAESNLELVRQLNILSTPTTLFLNRDGVEVGRAMGTPKRSQVLAAVAAVH
jgi:thiol-disulfide isomerase/thioredoxin